jgi:hypothetical protein
MFSRMEKPVKSCANLAQLNHRHEQIINWLVANPDRSLSDCAKEFNYTLPWISQIVHSDWFQVVYRKRCEELGSAVVHTVKDKLTSVAVAALERTHELLETKAGSERFVQDTTKNVLAALGYAPKAVVAAASQDQHLHVHVEGSLADRILAARERAAREAQGRSNGATPLALPAPSEALAPSETGPDPAPSIAEFMDLE